MPRHLTEQEKKVCAAIFTALLFLLCAAAFFVYAVVLGQGIRDVAEFIAYAMPAFAAIFAGWNAFFKKEIFLFWVSGIFVAFGLIAFLVYKQNVDLVLGDFVAFYGLLAIVILYPALRYLFHNPDRDWAIADPAIMLVVVLLSGIQLFSIFRNAQHHVPAKTQDLKCVQVSENKSTHHLMMDCRTVD